ncbi:MAG: hypothetical protein E7476_00550 [Ruminococcaceae bacterium]|nr:hypothetical protein [Oscillospiraceae bacterium]
MKNKEHLIDELKQLLPEYMAQKRILIGGKRNRMIRCINPVHEDLNPSMSYNRQNCTLHCFSCGVSYDLFDVIRMDYPECDSFPRQVKRACEIFGKPFPEEFGKSEKPSTSLIEQRAARRELKEPVADFTAHVEAEIVKNGMGGGYFAKRGLSQELCERYHLYESSGRAVLPIFTAGKCTCYCARAISENLQPRYKNSAGAMDVFGADYLSGEGKGGALFITEAVFDALSAEECGFQAMALCGVSNVRKFLALCEANPAAANSYTFLAAGDADEAGRRMNEELSAGLAVLGLECRTLELPEGTKDLNELLMKDREALRACLERAVNADRYQYERTNTANAVESLLDWTARRASRNAYSTGFYELDALLDGGLYAGLYIIGAISSLGKTSFVLQIADYIAEQETDVLYFSLEMSRMELMAKSISRTSYLLDPTAERSDALTMRQVLRGGLEEGSAQKTLFDSAVAAYRKAGEGLFIREGIADIGVQEIRRAVHEHIRLRGRKPVVIVDYLQILQPDDRRATDKQNTDRAVVELKRISRDFDVPVFAVSSFNRENYRNAVSMEAFKESGAVEYSSDVLLGLQLAGAGEPGFDVNAAKAASPRAVELVMLKNRSGLPYAKVAYRYNARFSCFTEGARLKR